MDNGEPAQTDSQEHSESPEESQPSNETSAPTPALPTRKPQRRSTRQTPTQPTTDTSNDFTAPLHHAQHRTVSLTKTPDGGHTQTTSESTLQSVAPLGLHNSDRGTLKLRLDLNIDVEITLKAKIRGDLELALL